MYIAIFSVISTVLIASTSFLVLERRILCFLRQKNLVQYNYAGNKVLNSGGLLILIPCLVSTLPLFFLSSCPVMPLYIIMMPALAFCGLLDDLLGDSSSKGLVEHINTFIQGNFSTGLLKALIGGLIGLLLAWSRYNGLLLLILDTLIFSFSVNLINLLDLRPGRAIKSFGVLTILIALMTNFSGIQLILPVLIVLMLYIKGEMKEIYMLGDTGANLLGGILGFYKVMVLTPTAKGMVLLFLLLLHIFAEFYSLSEIIENIPLLRKIDMLGRKQGER